MTIEEAIARHCGDYLDEDFPDNIEAYDYDSAGPLGGGGRGEEIREQTERKQYNALNSATKARE